MGSLVGLANDTMDVVEHTSSFLQEEESIALAESVLAVKPKPRPKSLPKQAGKTIWLDNIPYWIPNNHEPLSWEI